jgi:urease accessory protein
MNALLLLLLDSRAPAGAHHHSGGMEAAVGTGLVAGLADLEDFCRARLRTSARVAAAFAAASCDFYPERAVVSPAVYAEQWASLDAELDARTASEALRAASRQLGGGLLRLLRSLLPGADLAAPWARCAAPKTPHHPLVLGAGISMAGGTPELAARAAALSGCAMPASAAVRLLGLDPFAVQAMLARLAPEIDDCASGAARAAAGSPSSLPCDAAPALDLLADYHLTTEVRLFASLWSIADRNRRPGRQREDGAGRRVVPRAVR